MKELLRAAELMRNLQKQHDEAVTKKLDHVRSELVPKKIAAEKDFDRLLRKHTTPISTTNTFLL